jgi:hypothetical protein
VNAAISLNNQPCGIAGEVHHMSADRHLTPELETGQTAVAEE